MKYKQIPIEEIIKDFKAFRPKEQTISEFENELNQFLINAKKEDSEEYQKNEINKFLNKVFDYDCNVKGKIDSAIYEYGEPRVIFETKKINNKSEFVKENSNNLESKAFYESILYFLRENITNKNNNITFIILATAEIFYIIDAKNYLNNFAKNKEILKSFKNCEENGGTDNSTSKFYEEVKNIIPKIENEISYICVDFKNILDKEKDKLGLLYVLLSPQVLLKRTSYIDANTLNVEFYNELLYILGLKESKENGKIEYSEIKNTFYDSISKTFKLDKDNDFENIFSLLITWNNRILFLRLLESMLLNFEHIENPFLDLEYLPDFNNLNILFFEVLAKKENERTNIPKKLEMIPYLNSSLFEKKELERAGNEIKFLQSNNLKIYQHSILKRDKNFSVKYLKNNKTEELPLLEYLFLFLHAYDFTTTLQDLQNNVKTNYDKLINSAVLGLVFEKLNGYKDGSFYTPSFITNYMCRQSLEKIVLQKFNDKNPSWNAQSLEDIEDEIRREIRKARGNKNSDNNEASASATARCKRACRDDCPPSVRQAHCVQDTEGHKGLSQMDIYNADNNGALAHCVNNSEKCNYTEGHSDASGHKNMEKHKGLKPLVIRNADNNLNCEQIKDKYKAILDEIRICDPAVGSGHFLVSALNELLLIKYNLGLLIDEDGKKLKDIDLQLKNDEIVIKDSENNIHNYKRPKHERTEAHKIQRTIFFAKKEIIENNLFGVDINPNSCEITKLRLWIELLKYSYYKDIENKYLETLPNIDINIKCGNSLISYFDINQSLNRYPNIQDKIVEYKKLVKNYKNGIYNSKNEIDEKIKELLESFRTFCLNDKFFEQMNKFDRLCKEYNEKYGNYLVKDDKDLKKYFGQKNLFASQFDETEAKKDYEILVKKHNDIFNLDSKNPFEWRFAFPEVLDYEGNFTGFDLIIGNPPYIGEKGNKDKFIPIKNSSLKDFYQGKMDIFYFFFHLGLNLLHDNGILSFITTNYYPTALGAKKLREDLKNRSQIISLINFGLLRIFDSAQGQHNMITTLYKSKINQTTKIYSFIIKEHSISLENFIKSHKMTTLQECLNSREITTFYKSNNVYEGNEYYIRLSKNTDNTEFDKIFSKISGDGKYKLLGQICNVNNGVFSGADTLDNKKKNKYNINKNIGDGIFTISLQEYNLLNLNDKEKIIVKKLYKNSDIKKYICNLENDLYLINLRYTDRPNLNDYPNIEKHLLPYKNILVDRPQTGTLQSALAKGYWYVMSTSRRVNMETEKIVAPQRSNTNTFGYNECEWYAMSDVFFITPFDTNFKLKYILALLNSKLYYFWLYHKGKRKGENLELTQTPLSEIPIKSISLKEQEIFIDLVDRILQLKGKDVNSDTREFEGEIDRVVYGLYGLTGEEMKIIENGK